MAYNTQLFEAENVPPDVSGVIFLDKKPFEQMGKININKRGKYLIKLASSGAATHAYLILDENSIRIKYENSRDNSGANQPMTYVMAKGIQDLSIFHLTKQYPPESLRQSAEWIGHSGAEQNIILAKYAIVDGDRPQQLYLHDISPKQCCANDGGLDRRKRLYLSYDVEKIYCHNTNPDIIKAVTSRGLRSDLDRDHTYVEELILWRLKILHSARFFWIDYNYDYNDYVDQNGLWESIGLPKYFARYNFDHAMFFIVNFGDMFMIKTYDGLFSKIMQGQFMAWKREPASVEAAKQAKGQIAGNAIVARQSSNANGGKFLYYDLCIIYCGQGLYSISGKKRKYAELNM